MDILPGTGEQELAWLQKEYEVARTIQRSHPELVADWIRLSYDGHVLMMTSCPTQDGWVWQPPQDEAERHRYIAAVARATQQLETISFTDGMTDRLQLQPYIQQKILGDKHLQAIVNDTAIRQQLSERYEALASEGSQVQYRSCREMVRLLRNDKRLRRLLNIVTNLSMQPEDCFNHCDIEKKR